MMKTLNPVKFEHQAADALRLLLKEVPAIEDLDVHVAGQGQHPGVDLVANITTFGHQYQLVAEVTSSGQPRHVRSALVSLHDYVARQPDHVTPILIAPYLSPQAQAMCREFGVAYLDLEGNAWVAFGTVYISRQLEAKPVVERRALRSLFKPKSVQVLKVLLRDPSRVWKVAALAEVADVSLGHVSNVRKSLLDRELVTLANGGMYLAAPNELLDAWRAAYEPPAGQRLGFYTTLHGASFDAALKEASLTKVGQIALSSFSAAQWLAPFGRVGTHYFYADAAGLELIQSSLQLSTASKGENVVVTVLDDPWLLSDTVEPAPGIVCTSPVQTYLDLAAAGERGQEAAYYLRQERLQWQK